MVKSTQIVSFYCLLGLLLISACARNANQVREYVSVKSYGAKGDGKTDDRYAIQQALNSRKKVYFPNGIYLLRSKSKKQAFLMIDSESLVEYIKFAPNAILKIANNPPSDYAKPSALRIISRYKDRKRIEIDGFNLDGNCIYHNLKSGGIVAYEHRGTNIEALFLKNINIKNTGGIGIFTQALYNNFFNIKTINCQTHGIGMRNGSNPNQLHEFYLDNYHSENDEAYSIDFSGAEPKDRRFALASDQWKGKVRNVTSINAKYGIKTAGYWDLELENILIKNSRSNGFSLSKDAVGKTIRVKNMKVIDAKKNAITLVGNSTFIGEDIHLEGFKTALNIERTNVNINRLVVDGKLTNISGIRMSAQNIELRNFTIQNISEKETYPIWIKGENVILENGQFINNASAYEIIIHKKAREVLLKNLSVQPNPELSKTKNAIMNIQEEGTTKVINCDFSKINGKQITDKTSTIIIE